MKQGAFFWIYDTDFTRFEKSNYSSFCQIWRLSSQSSVTRCQAFQLFVALAIEFFPDAALVYFPIALINRMMSPKAAEKSRLLRFLASEKGTATRLMLKIAVTPMS